MTPPITDTTKAAADNSSCDNDDDDDDGVVNESSSTSSSSTNNINKKLYDFILDLPKVELHLHIEGSLEPEFLFELAQQRLLEDENENETSNNEDEEGNVSSSSSIEIIKQLLLTYPTATQLRDGYETFTNLNDFLTIYYTGCHVLKTQHDFYTLTMNYLLKCSNENVIHVEIMCDPQSHTNRGISFDTMIVGITTALEDGEHQYGITSSIICCFLRHLSVESATITLNQIIEWKKERLKQKQTDRIIGIGLDSTELNNHAYKFKKVFEDAQKSGIIPYACCHAGEEGSSSYIWDAIQSLNVHRIDHGVRCLEDPILVDYLVQHQLPLTICPLSNLKLAVISSLKDHPLHVMLQKKLQVSIHSDDPAYFGGYIMENYLSMTKALNLTSNELCQLAMNGINASWITTEQKQRYHKQLQQCCTKHHIEYEYTL